jgi:hypothetical protein
VSSASSRTFEDVKVGVRFKIAALWIAMLFLFAYGDIFGFFSPGQIQEVMAGELSGMAITQVFLFAVSLYVAVASVMVFFSLVLSPTVNRWTNIVLPSLYVVSILASAIGETSAYYWLLSLAESALLLLIVWYAWTWPRQEGSTLRAANLLVDSPLAAEARAVRLKAASAKFGNTRTHLAFSGDTRPISCGTRPIGLITIATHQPRPLTVQSN